MSLLEEKANEIVGNLKSPDGQVIKVVVDPATIALVFQVVVGVINLYKACRRTPQETAADMNAPGWWNRRKLWNAVKRAVPADQRDTVYEEVLRAGERIVVAEVEQMYQEVENGKG